MDMFRPWIGNLERTLSIPGRICDRVFISAERFIFVYHGRCGECGMIALFGSRCRKAIFILLLLSGALSSGLAQTNFEEHLKEFDGRYGYLHGASIHIVRSPRDGILYAIL